ncbi:acyltransferase family protein [Aminipila sp.]|uniref:acyltransferase family protein n=1 Tax=Aminipila sp. TaxID=2060095 RepID=UPI00289D2118|nr:acyltransferase family protein [Aminipila sp.]
MESTLNKIRIDWIDIYKGIAIILMVIGHSTGIFNNYIYQFHMAAFFFISGYSSNLEKKSFFRMLWEKSWRLLIPLITIFFILVGMTQVLEYGGIYNILFTESRLESFEIIKIFFKTGDNYIFWLGATWFIVTIFGIFIIQKIFIIICNGKINTLFIVCSTLTFILGYVMVNEGHHLQISIIPMDLVFIGQLYFSIGLLIKKYKIFEKIQKSKKLMVVLFFGCCMLMWYFGNSNPNTVDYPSRKFNSIVFDFISSMNGTILCYLIASFFDRKLKFAKRITIFLGKYTMAIVLFHFMFFKVSFYLLYLCGVTSFDYLQNFTPVGEISNMFWWMIGIIAIVLSIVLWKALSRITILNIFIGENKAVTDRWLIKILQINKIKQLSYLTETFFVTYQRSIDLFYTSLKNLINQNKLLTAEVTLFALLVCINFATPYIMCNDELQSRFWSMQGIDAFYNHFLQVHIEKGRALSSALVTTTMYGGFIGLESGLFRIIPTVTIVLDVIAFCYLLYKIFRSGKFSTFVGVIIVAFLPITFEHTSPMAFSALYNIPFFILLVALILYVNYLETCKTRSLVISMLLLFLTISSYELFITYVPLFVLIAIYYNTQMPKVKTQLLRAFVAPLLTGMIFLILYVICGYIFPSNYSGNQLGGFTFLSSIAIIRQLSLSCLPGYYLFNGKYVYLTRLFTEGYSIFDYLSLQIILTIVALIAVLSLLFMKKPTLSESRVTSIQKHLYVIGAGITFVILPSLPLAVSKMYQGIVNGENFIALPVTFFIYFAAVFTICYCIWNINQYINIKCSIIIAIIAIYCLPIQIMNETILQQHTHHYEKLMMCEDVLNTDVVKGLDYQRIYSSDLYKTRNALVIHNNYWTDYMKNLGLNINISNQYDGQALSLEYTNEEYFTLTDGKKEIVLSKKNLNGNKIALRIGNTNLYEDVTIENMGIKDRSFYRYVFLINPKLGLTNNLTACDANDILFSNLKKDVGSTLQTCEIVGGYWEDGWITSNSEFNIKSGKKGELLIKGYYPYENNSNKSINIFINGEKVSQYIIKEPNFTINLPCEPNSVINLKLSNDFSCVASKQDQREVSFILAELKGL